MKRGIRIVAFLLALLLLGGTLAGCAYVNKPLNYLKSVLEKTVEKRLGGSFLALLGDVLEGGSVEATYGGTDLFETPLESGSLKASFSRDEQKIDAVGKITVNGEVYDSRVYLTAEELATASDAFLGANCFGFRFADLTTENIKNSFFHNGARTDFSKEWFDDQIGDDLNTVKQNFFELYTSMEDIFALSDEVTELFLTALTENVPHHRYTEKGNVYITATVDNIGLSRALKETRNRIIKDRSICKELRRLAAVRDALESVKAAQTVRTWSNWVNDFIDAQVIVNELCAQIDNMTAFAFQLDATVDRSARVINTAAVSLRVDREALFSFSLDLTDKNTNTFCLTYGGAVRTLTHQVQKNGMRYYDATFAYTKAKPSGETVLSAFATLNADRRQDAFILRLTQGEEERVFDGSFDKKSNAFWFSVNGVTVNGVSRQLSLSLSLQGKSRMEPMMEYEPFFEVSETAYVPIDARVQSKKAALRAAWGEAPASGTAAAAFLLTVLGLEEEIPSITKNEA
ncbi:MAG: hypothetical protein E7585_09150 [Ruminococcaceae bacterium]|nr:hypothetical protein [Oscillospiraceae bacterium]